MMDMYDGVTEAKMTMIQNSNIRRIKDFHHQGKNPTLLSPSKYSCGAYMINDLYEECEEFK